MLFTLCSYTLVAPAWSCRGLQTHPVLSVLSAVLALLLSWPALAMSVAANVPVFVIILQLYRVKPQARPTPPRSSGAIL